MDDIMSEKKSEAEQLKKKLFSERKNAVLTMKEEDLKKCDQFGEDYKKFLDDAKTERESVSVSIALAEKAGFVAFQEGMSLKPGDKVYYNNREKAAVFAVIGKEPIAKGVRISVAHVDSPRLDLKQCPVYEDTEIALLKTHYYGGIKKYQWTAIPLALHGVIIKADGTSVTVRVGEEEGDPVFCVTDLLPHLAGDQMKRSSGELIKGEELNILIGSRPFKDDDASERVKLNILKLLNEKYGVVEDDFLSAELELVPAFKAKDIGFDRSMIGAYGHDDRVCAYTALRACLECDCPEKTILTVLADKEEIGSVGNTGLNSAFVKYFIADLGKCFQTDSWTILSHSECLSADVNAAFDPTFPDVSERRNTCYLNKGVVVTKFTGSRGKGGTSDASAEFMGRVRRLLDDNQVIWQTAELGRVDLGGGGTVAQFVAGMNVDVIDVGVPVLSMHAPYEIVSKIDVYMAYLAFVAFNQDRA